MVEQANKWGAELIVLGTHGRRGIKRMVLGSDAEHVVASVQRSGAAGARALMPPA